MEQYLRLSGMHFLMSNIGSIRTLLRQEVVFTKVWKDADRGKNILDLYERCE